MSIALGHFPLFRTARRMILSMVSLQIAVMTLLVETSWSLPIVSFGTNRTEAGAALVLANGMFSVDSTPITGEFGGSLPNLPPLRDGVFSLSNVVRSHDPFADGVLNQSISGGHFSIRSSANELLLGGSLGLGSLTASQANSFQLRSDIASFHGTLAGAFSATGSLTLRFIGLPTGVFEQVVSYANVFTGEYRQGEITGYKRVQVGTTRELTGYRNGRLKCLDYSSIGRGCIPVDANGYMLPQYVGKWLFLTTTPTPIRVYEKIPMYTERPRYEVVPIFARIPVYEVRRVETSVQTGWRWDSQMLGGQVTSNASAVPEPSTLALLSGAGLVLRRRRPQLTPRSVSP